MSASDTVGRVGGGTGWIAAGVAVLAVFVALGLLADAVSPGPSGPAGSYYSTAPEGVAAYAELLAQAGHRVDPLRTPLARAAPPPDAVLDVIDAGGLGHADARHLVTFVRAGGTLLLAGGNLNRLAPAIVAGAPKWEAAGSGWAQETTAGAKSLGVRSVLTAGPGTWLTGPRTGMVVRPGGALLLVRPLGRGRLELLADPSPLENRLLARADNAQLGLDLAGSPRQPVLFAEAIHGYGPAVGLAALPERWWAALGGLALAGGLWALSRARRLGPPERLAPAPTPARIAYIDALAGALVRTRDRAGLAELAARVPEPYGASAAGKLPAPTSSEQGEP